MTKNFLLPIEMNNHKKIIKKNLLKDLELLNGILVKMVFMKIYLTLLMNILKKF